MLCGGGGTGRRGGWVGEARRRRHGRGALPGHVRGRAAPRPEAPRAEPARRLVRRAQRHLGPGQARLLRVQKLPGLLAARARPAERRVLVVPPVAARVPWLSSASGTIVKEFLRAVWFVFLAHLPVLASTAQSPF